MLGRGVAKAVMTDAAGGGDARAAIRSAFDNSPRQTSQYVACGHLCCWREARSDCKSRHLLYMRSFVNHLLSLSERICSSDNSDVPHEKRLVIN